MPSYAPDGLIVIDGVESSWLAMSDPLVRAVVISLFTWRRARPDDPHEGTRWGWWGDGLQGRSATSNGSSAAATPSDPNDPQDRIGSRLWLLAREKLTPATLVRAREYAQEALQWLIEDGVASRVEVTAERRGLDGLALQCVIWRESFAAAAPLTLRFDNVWRTLNAV